MIIITGAVTLKPDSVEEALTLGREHSSRSRTEPGCIAHNCHIDAENADRMVFVEEWTDMEAVQTHFGVPASGEFMRQIGALAATKPEVRIFQADELPTG